MDLVRFTENDYKHYHDFAHAFHTGPATYTPPNKDIFQRNFDYILSDDSAFGWFIEEDGYRCGYVLSSMMYSTEIGGLMMWIEELCIEDEFQGKGFGTKTLNEIVLKFPEVKRFRLEVATSNNDAKRLYERLGYTFVGYDQMIFDRKDAE